MGDGSPPVGSGLAEARADAPATPDGRAGASGKPGPWHALLALAVVSLLLVIDAIFRSRGDFDYRLLNRIRGTEFPGVQGIANFLYDLGDPVVLLVVWLIGLGLFAALRRWLELAFWASFALAGAAAWALALAIGRPRPEPGDMGRSLPFIEEAGEAAFPSATIVGLVLVLGFLGVLARKLDPAWRWPVRALLVLGVLAMGWTSVILGRHWVGDVVAGYALGLLALLALAATYLNMAPVFGRLPLVRAAELPHDEDQPHAHALTSTIFFGPDTATKVYNPGFVPRFIYWLSFQAPFAYAYNELALEAAVLRRNLAGTLTEYWFGRNLVAPAIRVARRDTHLALVGRFTEGREPADRRRARSFLTELANRFDESGLPTWQIDPRQPRALGNILETPDGQYVVIDLESGMVSPVASPRAWWRSIRHARFPLFDDVFFQITRSYIGREETRMRELMGDEWFLRLKGEVAAAESAQTAWHDSEPRFWSACLRFFWSGFGIGPLWRSVGRTRDSGRDLALEWLAGAIKRWESEGRFTSAEAADARKRLADPSLQEVLAHFGVHLVIGIALRFPFGSITRASYTLGSLAVSLLAFAFGRSDLPTLRRSLSIHSPLVIVVAAMPGVGTFSYLLSGPMLANYRIWRVAVDAVGMKFPFHAYERVGARRIIAGRPRIAPKEATAS